jgi:hypothetical protein
VSPAGIVCQVTQLPAPIIPTTPWQQSDWRPSWSPRWPVEPDLDIPEFLRRPQPTATVESESALLDPIDEGALT